MTFPKHTRLAILFATAVILGACTADTTFPGQMDTSFRGRAESYISKNIAELSPRTATEGVFRVSDVEWLDEDTVRITYGDDRIELHATADVSDDTGTIVVSRLRMEKNNESESSR